MKKQAWITCFIAILIIHLAGILLNIQSVEYVSKPLIVLLLVFYFLSQTKKNDSGLKKWILAVLLFSWVGGVLLLFQQNDSLFFLLGLSAFLIAHIFYIVFFNHVRVKENIPRKVWLLLIVVIYYAVLIALLSPYLGDMKLPVRIYGIINHSLCCYFLTIITWLNCGIKRSRFMPVDLLLSCAYTKACNAQRD